MKLAISGLVLSMFDRLNNSYGTEYNPVDKVAKISVPDMGPASLDIDSNDIHQFSKVLKTFDPATKYSLIDTVQRSIEQTIVKGEEIVRFRTSMEKGARSVVVPVADWPDFVRFWEAAAAVTPDLLERYEEKYAELSAATKAE